MQEQIWHVDENDTPIGAIGRDDSRKQGARYRIVRVFIEDENGKILLQKRSETKKSYPGCWDTSAGGNIAYGESYEDAAKRELFEEAALDVSDMKEAAYFYSEVIAPNGDTMNRFTKLFIATVPATIVVLPQSEEVAELVWMTRHEVDEIVAEGMITDGLKQAYEQYYGVDK